MKIIDISLPIHNNMWCYRDEWKNLITTVSSTANGDPSTVYNFNVHSHTGTYIETSQHKLNNDILLTDFEIETFYANCKVVCLKDYNEKVITLTAVLTEMKKHEMVLNVGENIIISTGYGMNHLKDNYLSASPSFEPSLLNWVCDKKVRILGVDTPSIEDFKNPYQPVNKFFNSNPNSLLLAPLKINHSFVSTKEYTLNCLPSFLSEVSGSLTRVVLIEN